MVRLNHIEGVADGAGLGCETVCCERSRLSLPSAYAPPSLSYPSTFPIEAPVITSSKTPRHVAPLLTK